MTNKVSNFVTRELNSTFNEFNQLSERLIASYQVLEQRFSTIEKIQNSNRIGETLVSDSFLDSLPAAVVILNESGIVKKCNRTAVDLLQIDLLEKNWRAVIAAVFNPRVDDGHDISLRNGKRVNISTNPTPVGKGQILLIKDVTENRRLQDQLGHYRRLSSMGEIAAVLAHQIRTPLSSILLYLAQLKQPTMDHARRIVIIDTLVSLVRGSENLINDLLVFSKKDLAGHERIELDALLEQVRVSVQPKMDKCNIEFKIHNHLTGIKFYFHRQLLLSALQNLLQNAIEAIERNGKIEIVVEKCKQGYFDIKVQDNGKGVTPDIKDKICEPFFTTRQQGTGLGLAMVEAIVQANNSNLWFDSIENRGTTFALRIPYQFQNKAGESSESEEFGESLV